MQTFDFLDEIEFDKYETQEDNEEMDVEIFRKLPTDMINLILEFLGKNGMSTCTERRKKYLKYYVSIKSYRYLDKPNYEGLYLLLRYVRIMDYDCFSILSQSATIDLPNLEVLKIEEKTGNDIRNYNIKWIKMPKLKRIIFRSTLPYHVPIFSMQQSVYFSRLIQTIDNPCYIDAELEYHGSIFDKQMSYRKIIVSQRLLKNLAKNLIDKNKLRNNTDVIIKTLAIFIRDFRVFTELESSEIEVLYRFVRKIKIFNHRDTMTNIDKIPEFYERISQIFPDIKISVIANYEDIIELEKKYVLPKKVELLLL